RPLDRFVREAPHLLPLLSAERLEPFLREERRVGRDGFVAWERGWYGVPWTWAGPGRAGHRDRAHGRAVGRQHAAGGPPAGHAPRAAARAAGTVGRLAARRRSTAGRPARPAARRAGRRGAAARGLRRPRGSRPMIAAAQARQSLEH